MKPRIRLHWGVWYCGIADSATLIYPPYGHGYTPALAFEDWLAQSRRRSA